MEDMTAAECILIAMLAMFYGFSAAMTLMALGEEESAARFKMHPLWKVALVKLLILVFSPAIIIAVAIRLIFWERKP